MSGYEDENAGLEATEDAGAPGSRRAGAQNAQWQAEPPAAHVTAHQAELAGTVPGTGPVPVQGSVRSERPRDAVWRTMVFQAGQARQLLPQEPQRYRAVIIAVDQPVIICMNKDLATAPDNQFTVEGFPTGFWLPAGIAIVVESRALAWAVNPSQAAAAHVSVLIERHENPDAHQDS
jgi:hypothetical protein